MTSTHAKLFDDGDGDGGGDGGGGGGSGVATRGVGVRYGVALPLLLTLARPAIVRLRIPRQKRPPATRRQRTVARQTRPTRAKPFITRVHARDRTSANRAAIFVTSFRRRS